MTTKQEVSMLELVFSFGYYFMIGGAAVVFLNEFHDIIHRDSKLKMENSDLRERMAHLKGHLADLELKERLEENDSDN